MLGTRAACAQQGSVVRRAFAPSPLSLLIRRQAAGPAPKRSMTVPKVVQAVQTK